MALLRAQTPGAVNSAAELDQIDGELSDDGDIDHDDDDGRMEAAVGRILAADRKHGRADEPDATGYAPLHVLPLYSNLSPAKQAKASAPYLRLAVALTAAGV